MASGSSSSVTGPLSASTVTGNSGRRGRGLDGGRRRGRRRRGHVVVAAGGRGRGRAGQPRGLRETVEHVSPSARERCRRASGLLTRGSPLRRLPGLAGQWRLGEGASPLAAAGPCRTCTASLAAHLMSAEHTAGLRWAAVAAARLDLWLPVVVWAALIFTFSAIPSLGTGLGTWDLVLRKLAHAVEFGVLGALLYRALRRSRSRFCSARPTRSRTRSTRPSSRDGTARRSTGSSTRPESPRASCSTRAGRRRGREGRRGRPRRAR